MENRLQALIERNQLLDLILENSFGNVFVIDGQGKIIYVNGNARQALGVDRHKLLNMTIYELVNEDIANRAASIISLETGQECMQSVKLATGITLAVDAHPVFDEDGHVRYVIVFSQNELIVENFMRTIQEENQIISQTLEHLLKDVEDENHLIAESPAIRQCLEIAQRAARLDSTIILYGESGTGKEVVARYVHKHSRREKGMFIPVNCAAIPHELMESEFFGYVRGAFTGSSREGKLGLFELADGGTLFLDEVGELDLSMQSKLLRVLETGEVKRVGATDIRKVDVRIVAATNRDLRQMVEQGTFRDDLYYRLNVIPVVVPALRDRKEDIAALALCFLRKLNQKYSDDKRLCDDAIEALQAYSWPGNVRELRNVMERLFVITHGDLITGQNVGSVLGIGQQSREGRQPVLPEEVLEGLSIKAATEAFQRAYILQALKRNKGNVEKTAEDLHMARSGLYKKMGQLGLKVKNELI